MECPYCHSEMEPGNVISLRDPIFWCPKGQKAGWFTTRRGLERRGGFRLTSGYGKSEAWYCRACNRLVALNAK